MRSVDFAKAEKETRALVRPPRRRKHLVLLGKEPGTSSQDVVLQAIVQPKDAASLTDLVARLEDGAKRKADRTGGQRDEYRVSEIEDGYIDWWRAWHDSQLLEHYLKEQEPKAGVAHA